MHKVGQADNFIHIVLICLQQYIFIRLHFNYYFLCSILIILNVKKHSINFSKPWFNIGTTLELPFYCTFYKYESILLSYIKKKKLLQRKVYELLTLFRGLLGEIPGN